MNVAKSALAGRLWLSVNGCSPMGCFIAGHGWWWVDIVMGCSGGAGDFKAKCLQQPGAWIALALGMAGLRFDPLSPEIAVAGTLAGQCVCRFL